MHVNVLSLKCKYINLLRQKNKKTKIETIKMRDVNTQVTCIRVPIFKTVYVETLYKLSLHNI